MLLRSVLQRLFVATGSCKIRFCSPSQRLCSSATPSTLGSNGNTQHGDGSLTPEQLSAPNTEEVATALALDAEGKQKLHLMMLEYSELQLSGCRVPDNLSVDDWYELMLLKSYSGRKKFHSFLFIKEKKKLADMREKQQRKEEYLQKQRQEDEAYLSGEARHIRYGLGHNNIFERLADSKLQSIKDVRLYRAMQFGQPLVFDMGYEGDMVRRENKNTASQLLGAFMRNRNALDPFDLHFCHWNSSGEIAHFFQRLMPTIHEPSFPLHFHQQDFLEMFPREKVVYLTPHCREELQTFDREAVYVVGALVDLGDCKPLSLARAKKDNLRMAKLPINKYLSVGAAFNPALTLTAMMSILLEMRSSGCWERALEHVPRRGLQTPEQAAEIAARRSLKRRQEQVWAQKRQRRWDRERGFASVFQKDQDPGREPVSDPYIERKTGRPRGGKHGGGVPPARGSDVSARLSEVLSDWAAEDQSHGVTTTVVERAQVSRATGPSQTPLGWSERRPDAHGLERPRRRDPVTDESVLGRSGD